MIFYIKRMRDRGKPIEPKQLRAIEAMRADIHIIHESCTMGRASVVARLRGGWPFDEAPVPELLDVSLQSMAPNSMVLSGIEMIDGIAYAQSWLCQSVD